MDLTVAQNVEQDGVVLIGDAFQTSCPAAGTGVTRLLTDVDRLCNTHIPNWFATPGLGSSKIVQFYADPEKRAVDADSMGSHITAAHLRLIPACAGICIAGSTSCGGASSAGSTA